MHAVGDQTIAAGGVTQVSGSLQWTNPNPCTNQWGNAFSLEGVTLAQLNPGINGWVQTGWVKRQGALAPVQFCEFTGEEGSGFWTVVDTPLPSASEFVYKFRHDGGNREWECLRGATVVSVRDSDLMRFQSGHWVNAQGEVYAIHGQIGKSAPDKFKFSALQYYRAGSWNNMNVNVWSSGAPYGVDEPAVGQMRNWTNAH